MRAVGDPLLGTVLDRRYEMQALIARGGMSSVYLGLDTRLDRPVAIKVMDPRYSSDPKFLRRLEFEARAVARLKHPGLVPVYDQGVDEAWAFLVMELVDGGTLRELLTERGPMPPHAAAATLGGMLGGLGAAHDEGLAHRDIKPENVLISDAGEVKVGDFGLVRAVAAAGITSDSVILGTAAYLSPEQIEAGTADARSDVYSSGIVLYELLTGTTPFRGDSPLALANARLQNDVGPPSSRIAGVPAEFDDLVLTATSRKPEHRFVDANDMADAVTDVVAALNLPPFTVPAPRRSAERSTVTAFRTRHEQPRGTKAYDPRVQHLPDDRVDDATRRGVGHQQPIYATQIDRGSGINGYPRLGNEADNIDDQAGPPANRTRSYIPTSLNDHNPVNGDVPQRNSTLNHRSHSRHPEPNAHKRPIEQALNDYPIRREEGRRNAAIIALVVVVITVAMLAAGWWLGGQWGSHM